MNIIITGIAVELNGAVVEVLKVVQAVPVVFMSSEAGIEFRAK